MGNIGKEAPEIEVLPAEQPVPAERETEPAEHDARPARPGPVADPEPVPA